ncbi:hypothetical protein [Nonomuraea roseoviolacea]|uniref:Glycosyltransferase RgtA/B/C/D-like domain-containing protein n=1 Tax=Nonomuraea roseoviolacea subsp. carminata TaxID=160689 RepID=A0ABT1JX15_9ACTN|nr:hypothetical protein [Nonomuraea roseoviolacea]MCP2346135.1 hypothetical protein [Nonomuraea roseoviolacea subsp. carminata]
MLTETAKPSRWATLATFLAIQAVLVGWWLAYYPGLFSRDSVLYLSHTMVGPWVSDHSVTYDALLWLSVRLTGDIGAVTLLQTTAMAATLAYLAAALKALGAPRLATTAVAVLLPFLPPVGAFSVALWKDVPFTLCAVAIAASCAGLAAARRVTAWRLAGLGALMLALGLFRANGFLIVGVAVVVLLVVVKGARVRLAVTGLVAAAVPLLLTNLVLPRVGIEAPSKTYVYHTAFGDIAVLYREHPELFGDRDRTLMTSVAPLSRWSEGGTCYTINPLIWRRDFSWQQADRHAGELLDLWRRLLTQRPLDVVDARLCRGSIAWNPVEDAWAVGGQTYHFSRRPSAETYVGPNKVPDYPQRWMFSLRPKSEHLHRVADSWLVTTAEPGYDWWLWRGATWAYLAYVAAGLAAWALRNRYVPAVVAVVAGQQLAVLANISAQDYRYMATPIFVGMLMLPLLVGSLVRGLLGRRRPAAEPAGSAGPPESAETPESAEPAEPTERSDALPDNE